MYSGRAYMDQRSRDDDTRPELTQTDEHSGVGLDAGEPLGDDGHEHTNRAADKDHEEQSDAQRNVIVVLRPSAALIDRVALRVDAVRDARVVVARDLVGGGHSARFLRRPAIGSLAELITLSVDAVQDAAMVLAGDAVLLPVDGIACGIDTVGNTVVGMARN